MLEKEGEFLVKTARNAFVTFLTKVERSPLPPDVPRKLWEGQGVFVRVGRSQDMSWTSDMEILGCLGYPFPSRELILATMDSTIACAVSVITEPELMKGRTSTEYPKKIELGKDGLIIQYGFASGLILPQVSIEKHYDEKDLLSECCIKAGLPCDSWLTSPDIDIYKFQAEIFRETGIDGKVVKFDPKVSKTREKS